MDFGLKKVNAKKKTMSVPEMRKLLGLGKTIQIPQNYRRTTGNGLPAVVFRSGDFCHTWNTTQEFRL